MPLRVSVRTFGLAAEPAQQAEILAQVAALKPGSAALFPEYGAYTAAGGEALAATLAAAARARGVSIITTLNLAPPGLPHAAAGTRYNAVCVFTPQGAMHTPQAKITPQSFEMRHLDPRYTRIDVAPYSYLNRVRLRQGGREYTAVFFICSDLYALQLFTWRQLKADALFCLANFGNGAEKTAGNLIRHAVDTGLFRQGFYCNTGQKAGKGRVPLTRPMLKTYAAPVKRLPYRQARMRALVRRGSAVYPDGGADRFRNFQEMLPLTRQGTFTVPRSRSAEGGLRVQVDDYAPVIEL